MKNQNTEGIEKNLNSLKTELSIVKKCCRNMGFGEEINFFL